MNLSSHFKNFLLGLFLFVKLVFATKYGLVEITERNFQTMVFRGGKEAWIIAIKGAGGVSLEEWKETEFNLRGMSVRVGVIDPDKEGVSVLRLLTLSLLTVPTQKSTILLSATVKYCSTAFQ